jgi:hypothetical protein
VVRIVGDEHTVEALAKTPSQIPALLAPAPAVLREIPV